jgi:hypothetical protein
MSVTYAEAEKVIKSGDLVFFKAGTLIQKMVAFFTRGAFSHVGIAFWMENNAGEETLFFVDSAPGSGRKISLLSSFSRHKMEIVSCGLDWDKVAGFALKNTGTSHYSYIDAIMMGIEKTLRINIFNKPRGEVCSEFVAAVLNKGEIKVRPDIDPNSLYSDVIDMHDTVVTAIIN